MGEFFPAEAFFSRDGLTAEKSECYFSPVFPIHDATVIPGSPVPLSPFHGALTAAAWLASSSLPAIADRAAYRHGLDREDARDVLQETLIALWNVGPEHPVNSSWVHETANHKAANLSRQRRKAALVPLEDVERSEAASRQRSDPDLLPLLRARAGSLTGRLRVFYELKFRADLSEREIARKLGVSRSSVRNLERRCLRMIAGRAATEGRLRPN